MFFFLNYQLIIQTFFFSNYFLLFEEEEQQPKGQLLHDFLDLFVKKSIRYIFFTIQIKQTNPIKYTIIC